MFNRDKFIEYYTPIQDEETRELVIKSTQNKKIYIQDSLKLYYFLFGKEVSKNELQELIDTGIVMSVTGKDLYKTFFTDDQIKDFYYVSKNIDAKTYDYIKGIKEGIDLIDIQTTFSANQNSGTVFELQFDNMLGTPIMYEKNSLYVVEMLFKEELTNNSLKRYIFSAKPNIEDIISAYYIDFVIECFSTRVEKTLFNCYLCNRKTHWVDTPGGLKQKINYLQKHYCGC